MHEIDTAVRWLCLFALCGCTSHALRGDLQRASAHGSKAMSEPIAQCDYVAVDGARLFVALRGDDRRAPVLLWLHGGPGGAERPLFRYFDSDRCSRI
jgi:hypothetical protein